MLNKIKQKYEKILKYFKKGATHVKKASRLDKDIVLGSLCLYPVKHVKEGVKVTGPHGIGHIKKVKFPWITVTYFSGRTAEHKQNKLYQIFFSVYDRVQEQVRIFPLSYADYGYIHPDERR